MEGAGGEPKGDFKTFSLGRAPESGAAGADASAVSVGAETVFKIFSLGMLPAAGTGAGSWGSGASMAGFATPAAWAKATAWASARAFWASATLARASCIWASTEESARGLEASSCFACSAASLARSSSAAMRAASFSAATRAASTASCSALILAASFSAAILAASFSVAIRAASSSAAAFSAAILSASACSCSTARSFFLLPGQFGLQFRSKKTRLGHFHTFRCGRYEFHFGLRCGGGRHQTAALRAPGETAEILADQS